MMLKKYEFIDALQTFHKLQRVGDVLSNELHMDFPIEDMYYNLLSKTLSEWEEEWVAKYIWDYNWGTEVKPGAVQVQGKDWSLKTEEDLYDFLKLTGPNYTYELKT